MEGENLSQKFGESQPKTERGEVCPILIWDFGGVEATANSATK